MTLRLLPAQLDVLTQPLLTSYIITMKAAAGPTVGWGIIAKYNMSTCLFGLSLEGRRQHFREKFEEHGKKELHEGNNDKDHEGHQSKQISTGPHQL